MSSVFDALQLQRIAQAIEDGYAGGGSLTIDVTGVGDMQPATATTAGAHGLVPAPAAGDGNKVLSGAGTWIDAGGGGELGDLEDVTITSPTSGESLKYDGSKWVNGNVTAELPDFIEETSGNIVTVEAAERPAKSLKVAINPVQSGSGDPSPDNIRPISGWTGANVIRTGKNLWGGEKLADDIAAKVNEAVKNATAKTITYWAQKINNVILFDGFNPNTQYTIILNGTGYANMRFKYSDGTTEVLGGTLSTTSKAFASNPSKSITALAGTWSSGQTVLNYEQCGIFEGNITVDNFTPYTGTTYPIPFPPEAGTVYGGTLDVTNGTLTVTKANIASYDGETLPGAWISDRDVYAEGTTPTTGAQVVYDLGTPQTYQLTPTEVQMLLGTNNIWADTGEVQELKYIPQTYNDLLEEVTGGGYDITTNGAPVETGITWDGYPVKCFCVRYYNLSLNTNSQDISLEQYGFSDTINGLFKVDCIVQNDDNMLNVTPHVHYDGHGNLRGRYDTSENFSGGTGYIFIYYY